MKKKRHIKLRLSLGMVVLVLFFAIDSISMAQQQQGQQPPLVAPMQPREKVKKIGPTSIVQQPPADVNPNEQYIPCPCQEVRAEITTPLSEGWWNTPQVGKLNRTQIENIGGSPTLKCGYRTYNTVVYIMHKFPEGIADCKEAKGGFVCH